MNRNNKRNLLERIMQGEATDADVERLQKTSEPLIVTFEISDITIPVQDNEPTYHIRTYTDGRPAYGYYKYPDGREEPAP